MLHWHRGRTEHTNEHATPCSIFYTISHNETKVSRLDRIIADFHEEKSQLIQILIEVLQKKHEMLSIFERNQNAALEFWCRIQV